MSSDRAVLWATFSLLAFVPLLASAAKAQNGDSLQSFREVVAIHLERYPAMEIQDLYKLALQAAMGSEHAVPDRRAAAQWLEREMSSLQDSPPEPFSEPLSPDGRLVRVNLRSFREQGGEMSRLLEAFVTTASRFAGSEMRLRDYWGDIGSMAEADEIPFDIIQVHELWTDLKSWGFPAVHHSASYREHYRPAYRVVLLELLSVEAQTTTGE